MKICFSFDRLYPAEGRAGRHIETLARRFQSRDHEVFVVTTPVDEPQDPVGIDVMRLKEPPGRKGHERGDLLLQKAITKYLKQHEVEVVFAEGLTPLTATTIKAAKKAGAKTIIRVLADASGVVTTIGQERRLTPSALKKRIATMLKHADQAAASSERCATLLRDYYDGDIRVIEKCVDLEFFKHTRVTTKDVDVFRERFELGERPILLYAREEVRAETIVGTFGLMKELAERRDDVVYVIAGKIEESEDLDAKIAEAGLGDSFRFLGNTSQRTLFAAYAAADVFLAPFDSRASESELIEAMAMRCALACYGPKAAMAPEAVQVNDSALVLNDEETSVAADELAVLLGDAPRLESLKEHALDRARRMDIGEAVNRVQNQCEELLELPITDFAVEAEVEAKEEDATESTESDADEAQVEEGDGEASEASGSRRSKRPKPVRADASADGDTDGNTDASDESEDAETSDDEGSDEPDKPSEEEIIAKANQRLRELDPKLTLRDLMPFLRPPKNVFVMSLATGSGQHRAGEAVYEAFKGFDQNLRVHQVNILDHTSREYGPDEVMPVLREMGQNPALFGSPFDTDDQGRVENPAEANGSFLEKVFGTSMRSLILDKRPDQIILTHYLPLRFISDLKKEHELVRMRLCVLVTDYDLHPHWMAEEVDQYLVTNEKVKYKLIKAGVDRSLIEVVGLPVDPGFEENIDREKVRRSLRIRGNLPTILLRPGGIGPTDAIVETIEQIIEVGYSFNLLVMAGRNQGLVDAVKSMEAPKGVHLHAFGFVDNINEILGTSDLMITRASGHTVGEAFAAGLPMILLRPTPGVEERTADWFLERGVALQAHDPLDLEWILTDLLRSQAKNLRRMRDVARNGSRPTRGSAKSAAERIANTLH